MNENTNAVREAQYAKEKAEYDAAMLRHRELMSRRAGAKRGELHEQFAQAAQAAEDDDASTSSKENGRRGTFCRPTLRRRHAIPRMCSTHDSHGGCPMRTARAARAAFSEWRVAPLPYAKQMEHRCLRSMARHARVEGQVQVQVQVQAQVQVLCRCMCTCR